MALSQVVEAVLEVAALVEAALEVAALAVAALKVVASELPICSRSSAAAATAAARGEPGSPCVRGQA